MHTTEPHAASQLLSLPLEIKAEGDTGIFEGYGAIFGNKDRDGDIVARGAFAESLKGGMPAMLWQHDQKAPIGKFDEVREDDKGLYVKGKLVMQGRGLEAYELLKMGALNGLSIGFVTKEASRDPASNTRTISKADLMEISLVTFPANELARVNNVKAAFTETEETKMFEPPISDMRSFERLLRENGFSRSRAKAITAKGFKAVDLGDYETAEIAEMVRELKARQVNIENTKLPFVECKSFGPKRLAANPKILGFGSFTPLWGFTTTEPAEIKLRIKTVRNVRAKAHYEVEFKYASQSGMRIQKLQSFSPQATLKVAKGMQEIQARAKSLRTEPQDLLISARWV